MLNIQTSPSLDKSTTQMHLFIEISTRLQGRNDIFSISIRAAIRNNKPTKLILQTIKDAIQDNYNAVADVLGKLLTDKILKQ